MGIIPNLNCFGVGLGLSLCCSRIGQSSPMPIFRYFTSSHSCMKNNYLSREAKFMGRLINTPKKKRKLFFEDSVPISIGKGPKLSYHGGKENMRRVAVLNSVFMKHISDLLMTGVMAVDVVDKNLEISRVSIAPCFTVLNIFWSTNTAENATALEEVLPRVGFSLRHELSQLRVMGVVPKITFVRDKQMKNAMQVDYLLKVADFGEDHVPLHQGSEFKNGLEVEDTVVIGKREKLEVDGKSSEDLDDTQTQEDETFLGETMPQMRHDIFNLNHELILNKIAKSVKKSRAVHRYQPNLAVDCDGVDSLEESTSAAAEDILTKEERRSAMANFILARKILMDKRSRNKYKSELNVGPNQTQDNVDEYECDDLKTEDYIDEDYFENQKYN